MSKNKERFRVLNSEAVKLSAYLENHGHSGFNLHLDKEGFHAQKNDGTYLRGWMDREECMAFLDGMRGMLTLLGK